jgi:hypothetical protein
LKPDGALYAAAVHCIAGFTLGSHAHTALARHTALLVPQP